MGRWEYNRMTVRCTSCGTEGSVNLGENANPLHHQMKLDEHVESIEGPFVASIEARHLTITCAGCGRKA